MSKKKVVCRNGAELLAFAADEYLSEVMLRALTEPTKKVPASVELEWGLVIPGEGASKFQSYRVQATGVTKWSLDGAWDKTHVIEMDMPATKTRIQLVQSVPGMLELECASLTIERGALKRYTLPPKIHDDRFLVFGAREVTWTELREWLAVPAELDMFVQTAEDTLVDRAKDDEAIRSTATSGYHAMHKFQRVAGEEQPWIYVDMMLGVGKRGHYFQIYRGTCDDTAWANALQLPAKLGPCEVMSGTVRCTGEQWLAKWARPTVEPSAPTSGKRSATAAASARSTKKQAKDKPAKNKPAKNKPAKR